MPVLAQAIEVTAGAIVAGAFAIVSPLLILGGIFVAVGRQRQRQDSHEKRLNRLEDRDLAHAASDTQITERLRGEIDGHAKMLRMEIQEQGRRGEKAIRGVVRTLDPRLGSLERWRQRMLGREQAMAAAAGVPHPVSSDQTTRPMAVPHPTPRIHQSSTHYPVAADESDDEG